MNDFSCDSAPRFLFSVSLAYSPVRHPCHPLLSIPPFLLPSFPISVSRFLSLTVALILCTWWSKSGNSSTRAFCQTDYGTSAVSPSRSRHPIMRPVYFSRSLTVLFSLCLWVSVLIRHFVDSMHRAYVRTVHTCTRDVNVSDTRSTTPPPPHSAYTWRSDELECGRWVVE